VEYPCKLPLKISQLICNGKVIVGDKKAVNKFNDFFQLLVQTQTKKPFKFPVNYLRNRVTNGFLITYTTKKEIIQIIQNLNNNEACGPSNVPINLPKLFVPYMTAPSVIL
jgi:hypothetical protein